MNTPSLVERLEKDLQGVGIKRLVLEPSADVLKRFGGVVFCSTVGPYNPRLFSDGSFPGERRMIEAYLKVHSRVIAAQIPSILMVRDQFALGMPAGPDGGPADQRQVANLVREISHFSIDYLGRELGWTPGQHLFHVVRESQIRDVDDVQSFRLFASINLDQIMSRFQDLDVRNGLDLFSVFKKEPQIMAATNLYAPDRFPFLIEWERTVRLWREAGVPVSIGVAELETIEGPRDMRTFYERGFQSLASASA